MIKAFFGNRQWAGWAYGIGVSILVLVWVGVQYSIKFNEWYGHFYDLLQNVRNHPIKDFYASMGVFLKLALPWMMVDTARNYLSRLYAFKWREALTLDYLPRWLNIREGVEGASQRLQEDAFRLSRLVEDFGLKTVDALLTLIAFIPVLWGLSKGIGSIPGLLVWVVLGTSVGGTVVAGLVGLRLTGLEYANQRVEAAFRKDLVYGEDDKTRISLLSLVSLFAGVKTNYLRLYQNILYYDAWVNLFNQSTVVLPYVLAAPGLFAGILTLGTVIRIGDAFGNVQGAFNLLINNYVSLTELRSVIQRLREFERVLPHG